MNWTVLAFAMPRTLSIVAAFALIAGCATGPTPTVRFHEVSPKSKDGAIVYVYRMPSIVGAAVSWAVRLDDVRVASIRTGTYTVVHTTPGVHSIWVADRQASVVGAILDASVNKAGAFSAEPNGVYFLRCSGFSVNYVTREVAIKEISDLLFDPNL